MRQERWQYFSSFIWESETLSRRTRRQRTVKRESRQTRYFMKLFSTFSTFSWVTKWNEMAIFRTRSLHSFFTFLVLSKCRIFFCLDYEKVNFLHFTPDSFFVDVVVAAEQLSRKIILMVKFFSVGKGRNSDVTRPAARRILISQLFFDFSIIQSFLTLYIVRLPMDRGGGKRQFLIHPITSLKSQTLNELPIEGSGWTVY